MQTCCRCGHNTSFEIGSDEALYRPDGTGPYCDDCFEQEPVIEAIEDARAKDLLEKIAKEQHHEKTHP